MNRRDIQDLRFYRGYPSVTIIVPCDIGYVTKMFEHCMEQIPDAHMRNHLRQRFTNLIAQFKCRDHHMAALFLNMRVARIYIVPCALEEIAYVGDGFILDGVRRCLNRTQRYWVISYNRKQPRIYEGYGNAQIDIAEARIDETGNDFIAEFKERTKEKSPADLWQSLNAYLQHYYEHDRLPLFILTDDDEEQRDVQEFSAYRDYITAYLRQFEDLWPALQNVYAHDIERAFSYLHEDSEEHTSDLKDIIKAARSGLVHTLLIEAGYDKAGCEDPVTRGITEASRCHGSSIPVSIIDELIEAVRSKGGTLLFVPEGTLSSYGGIVAITLLIVAFYFFY